MGVGKGRGEGGGMEGGMEGRWKGDGRGMEGGWKGDAKGRGMEGGWKGDAKGRGGHTIYPLGYLGASLLLGMAGAEWFESVVGGRWRVFVEWVTDMTGWLMVVGGEAGRLEVCCGGWVRGGGVSAVGGEQSSGRSRVAAAAAGGRRCRRCGCRNCKEDRWVVETWRRCVSVEGVLEGLSYSKFMPVSLEAVMIGRVSR